jgi:hypothetical protein
MTNLEKITSAKILAAVQRLLETLTSDIETLKRLNASKGSLKSGATVKQVIRLCISSMDTARDLATVEYGVLIQEGLWVKPSLLSRLEGDAKSHLALILQATKEQLKSITALVGSPDQYRAQKLKLLSAHDRAINDIVLFIGSQSSIKRNRLLIKLGGAVVVAVFGWIFKQFGISKGS